MSCVITLYNNGAVMYIEMVCMYMYNSECVHYVGLNCLYSCVCACVCAKLVLAKGDQISCLANLKRRSSHDSVEVYQTRTEHQILCYKETPELRTPL